MRFIFSSQSSQPCLTAIAATAIVVSAVATAGAATPEQKCQDAVANGGLKYFSAVVKTVSKCELGRSSGALTETINCRPSAGPVTDATTDTKLQAAKSKLESTITGKCGTVNLADVPVGGPCTGLANATALANCLADDAHGADAEGLVETIFNDTGVITGVVYADTRKCQSIVAKTAAKHAATRLKERRKCGKSLVAGKIQGPCPDATTLERLEVARAKFIDKVEKKCGNDEVSGGLGLSPGFPCDLFQYSTFDRGPGGNNAVPVYTRYSRCMAAATAGAGDKGADTGYPLPDAGPFSLGVAAGDATETAFIAWTRTTDPSDVTLEVATDQDFASIVATQSALTPNAAADNTVKTEVTGLTAGTRYYYRFSQSGSTSRVGRVTTVPPASSTEQFTFAFTGDSNAYYKPFTPLEQLTADDPDVWLYIGDTIYSDDARSGTGVATTRSEYHNKYRENREDSAMRNALAGIGSYTVWDDHEVTNDFWGTDPSIATQMADGNQAYRDYFPLREDGGDPMKLYRSFKWGDVAEFFLIDTRQYRSAQAYVTEPRCIEGVCSVTTATVCEEDAQCPGLETCFKGTCSDTGDPCGIDSDCNVYQLGQTCEENAPPSVPNASCATEIENPARTYLGAAQLAWLKNGLLNSTATFKFVMNGPLLSSLQFVPYDRWEGYAAERQDFIDFVETNSIKNVVFLSTDIHAAIANSSVDGSSIVELVAGAIGMDTIRRELPADVASLVQLLPVVFPTVTYYDIDRFNVATATVSQTELKMTWKDGSGQVLKTLTVPAE